MPFASRVGPRAAAALWATGTALAFREAGSRPRTHDASFSVLNATYLSAVVAHFAGWPRTRLLGMPWLVECEGLAGPVIVPYNVILYVSGVAAVGGLVENGRGRALGLLVPAALVPLLMVAQRREFARLLVRARRHPSWTTRRLRRQYARPV
jgi:hypothetical protein